MMAMMDKNQINEMANNLTFEINPNHELMKNLNEVRKVSPQSAAIMAKQILDSCLLTSGMLTEPKFFIERAY